jgi:uncharacterized protein (DUF427 family)
MYLADLSITTTPPTSMSNRLVNLKNHLNTATAKMSTTAKLNPRNFPRPPLCERTPRHLKVVWNGTTIAETKEAFWVLETYHPPTYYLPPSSLKVELQTTPRRSYCEWKGNATYYAATNPKDPKDVVKDRIWSYESPTEGFKGIDGFLSFYAGPWECFVDGEKVEAQPGDFYGGWMTQDIERSSVKGAPGTRGW